MRIGVITCGGAGERFEGNTQKCLVKIRGKPIVEYVIEAFVANGVRVIYLLTGHHHESVNDYLVGLEGTYRQCVLASVYGGMGGDGLALLQLVPALSEPFLFGAADTVVPNETLGDILKLYQRNPALAVFGGNTNIAVAPRHPRLLLKSDGDLERIIYLNGLGDRAPEVVVGMGVNVFTPEVLVYLERSLFLSPRPMAFANLAIAEGKRIAVHVSQEPWFSLHTKSDLDQALASNVWSRFN